MGIKVVIENYIDRYVVHTYVEIMKFINKSSKQWLNITSVIYKSSQLMETRQLQIISWHLQKKFNLKQNIINFYVKGRFIFCIVMFSH